MTVEMRGAHDATAKCRELYRAFEAHGLAPLWTQVGDLMPLEPRPRAVPHLWQWDDVLPLARQAGDLVPVGRGGERRAIALANPGLEGAPAATSTLWAAIQYLGPGETAPPHRHSQHALRFVIDGEGALTTVGGDPVVMRRGDFLPQAGWNWHAHRAGGTRPTVWLDGLDIPLARHLDLTFFEPGDQGVAAGPPPARCRSERLWAHPGLLPVGRGTPSRGTPLLAYRWEATDRALDEQLRLEDEGHQVTADPGHAAVRYVNPATGADVLPTLRAEFHRLRPGATLGPRRELGSSVLHVFDGSGEVTVQETTWRLARGDLLAVPSWAVLRIHADERRAGEPGGLDLFCFSDSPVVEALSAGGAGTPGS